MPFLESEVNEHAIYEVVRMQMAAKRSGHCGYEGTQRSERRREKALAPKRNRPGEVRFDPVSDLERRRHRLRSPAARLFLLGSEKGAQGSPEIGAEPSRCRDQENLDPQ